jgi:hypothetical protein
MLQQFKTPGVKNRLDHISVCRGNLVCPRCGRKMCRGCTTYTNKGRETGFTKNSGEHLKGHIGECLICSEMYTEDHIILHPANKDWIYLKKKICNHSDKRYRLIRLNVGSK